MESKEIRRRLVEGVEGLIRGEGRVATINVGEECGGDIVLLKVDPKEVHFPLRPYDAEGKEVYVVAAALPANLKMEVLHDYGITDPFTVEEVTLAALSCALFEDVAKVASTPLSSLPPSMAAALPALHTSYLSPMNLLPLKHVNEARSLLALYLSSFVPPSPLPALLVLTASENDLCIIGNGIEVSNSGDGGSVVSYSLRHDTAPLPSKQELSATISSIQDNQAGFNATVTTNYQAQYSLWGDVSQEMIGSSAPLKSPASHVLLQWTSQNVFSVSPPPQAEGIILLRGAGHNVASESLAVNFATELNILSNILVHIHSGAVINTKESTDVITEVRRLVSPSLPVGSSSKEKHNVTSSESLLSMGDGDLNDILRSRIDLDFTELLWNICKAKFEDPEAIKEALGVVLDALKDGDFLPQVDKGNSTLLGTLMRDGIALKATKRYGNSVTAVTGKSLSESTDKALSNPLIVILELGLWKISRDFAAVFRRSGLTLALNFYLYDGMNILEDDQARAIYAFQSSLKKLYRLKDILELVVLSLGVGLPLKSLKDTIQQALAFYEEFHSSETPLFLSLLPSPLPPRLARDMITPSSFEVQVLSRDEKSNHLSSKTVLYSLAPTMSTPKTTDVFRISDRVSSKIARMLQAASNLDGDTWLAVNNFLRSVSMASDVNKHYVNALPEEAGEKRLYHRYTFERSQHNFGLN